MPDRPRRTPPVPAQPVAILSPEQAVRRARPDAYLLHDGRSGLDQYRVQDRGRQAYSEGLRYVDWCRSPNLVLLSGWHDTAASAQAASAAGLAGGRESDRGPTDARQ